MQNWKQYSKAIAGFATPVLAIWLIRGAESLGVELNSGLAGIIATLIIGLATGLLVYGVRNAPPGLVDAIQDALDGEQDGSQG